MDQVKYIEEFVLKKKKIYCVKLNLKNFKQRRDTWKWYFCEILNLKKK